MSSKLGYLGRKQDREVNFKKIKEQAKKFIRQIWITPTAIEECHSVVYPQIDAQLRKEFNNTQAYQLARIEFLRFIRELNLQRADLFPEPSIPIRLSRQEPIKKLDWLREGRKVTELANQAIHYWSNHQDYSLEETLGWTLFSAAVWGGLNDPEALNDLLRALITKRQVYRLADSVALMHLEAKDSSYGSTIVHTTTAPKVTRSYTFVLDHMTRCWLIRLKSHTFDSKITATAESLLRVVLKQLAPEINFTKQDAIAKFLKFSSYHWEQLPEVEVNQALVQVMTNRQRCCSLSAEEFSQFYAPQLAIPPTTIQLNTNELLKGVIPAIVKTSNKPLYLKQAQHITAEIKQALNIKPIAKAASALKDIADRYQVASIVRLVTWIRDLLLAEHSGKLRLDTIERYMSSVADPWLVFTDETDVNNYDELDYEELYKVILSQSSDIGRAYDAKLLLRFHKFQMSQHDAPHVDIAMGESFQICRARMVGPAVYRSMLTLLENATGVDGRDKTTCKLLVILAYRTGMRREEIVKLQFRDIERGEELAFIVRSSPMGTIKTSSAFRRIPIWALLDNNELLLLKGYLANGWMLSKRDINAVVFTVADTRHKLPSEFPSRLVNVLFNHVLTKHHYSYHSFRHTALSNLALILNARQELITDLTDYSSDMCDRIRHALLGHDHNGQDRWFALAQVAGHLSPDHTFLHYIHLAQLMGSYKLSQSHLVMPFSAIHNITGYRSRTIVRHAPEVFSKNYTTIPMKDIRGLLIRDLSAFSYKKPERTDLEFEELENNTYSYAGFKLDEMYDHLPNAFTGTISMQTVHNVLHAIEKGASQALAAEAQRVPEDLVQEWINRAKILATLPTRSGESRLFIKERCTSNPYEALVPRYPQGQFEQDHVKHFFGKVYKLRQEIQEDLYKFLDLFLAKTRVTKSDLRFRTKDIELFIYFFEVGRLLIRDSDWRISAPTEGLAKDIKTKLRLAENFSMDVRWKDYNGYSLSLKKPKAKYTTQNNEKQNNNSSSALKYACHLLAIADLNYPLQSIERRLKNYDLEIESDDIDI